MSESEKANFVGQLIREIAQDIGARHAGPPWLLGFTSGLDSRLLYYALSGVGVPLELYTFGQTGNADYDFAKLASKKLDVPIRLFDTTELNWTLGEFDQLTPQVRDKPVSPRLKVASTLTAERGKYTEVHGFLNDHITGSSVPKKPSKSWNEAVDFFCESNDQFGFQSHADRKMLRSLLPARPFESELDYDRQLDLGYRQMQRIRPTDHLGVSYVCPFLDQRWAGFWLNRTHHELRKQRLYVKALLGLGADVFFDLNALAAEKLPIRKKQRQEFLYGPNLKQRQVKADKKAIPLSAGSHFCFFSCYCNNKSFKSFVDESVMRISKRRVFRQAFLDDVFQKFLAGDRAAEKMVKGVVSIDIGIEGNLF